MIETPGMALRRVRIERGHKLKFVAGMVGTSVGAVGNVEGLRSEVPKRWIDLLPPEYAAPILTAMIDRKFLEIRELAKLLERLSPL